MTTPSRQIISDDLRTAGFNSLSDEWAATRNVTGEPASASANGLMTSADKSKLNGIQVGATANSTDAQLRDRSTHTGSQTIGTITNLQTSLDAKTTASDLASTDVGKGAALVGDTKFGSAQTRFDAIDNAGLVIPTSAGQAGVASALASSKNIPVVTIGDQVWTGIVDISAKQVNLDLSAAIIARNTTNFAIRITMPYLDVTSVTSVELYSGSFGGGLGGSDTSRVSSLLVAAGSAILTNLTAGDCIKIVADDFIPSATGTTERVGEHAYVAYVTGNRIVLDRVLTETYTTAIRVARNTSWPVKIVGGALRDQATGTKSSLALIQIIGAVRPVVEGVSVVRGDARAVEFVSCMEPRSINCRFDRLDTDEATGRYGYGIIERCCTDGFHTGLSGRQVRHVYTSNTLDATAGDTRIERFGACIGTSITGFCGANLGAGFDTHPEASKVTFVGCVSKNGKAGQNTREANFQLRGRECKIINGTSEGGTALSIVSTGTQDGLHSINLQHRILRSGVISPTLKVLGPSSAAREMIASGRVVVTGECDSTTIVETNNTIIRMQSLHVDVAQNGAAISTPPIVFDVTSATIEIDEVTLDFSRGSGSLNWRIAEFRDTAGIVKIGTLRVIKGSSPASWYVADFNGFSGNQVLIDRLIFDTAPSSGGITGSATGSSITTGPGRPPVYGQLSAADTTLVRAGSYILFASLSAAAITVTLPVGIEPGSVVRITRSTSSGSSNGLSVSASGTTLVTLATGQWADFVANANSNWSTVAKGALT